ncbi:hypothetical protein PQQ63_06045 [Paraburkholderia metrosideri]|uniref:DNA methyltransferase n=1 Tax=Paraburkholderia metrosideri TaxID=580937 RepID=A0ABW9DLN4_9BURK
MNLTSLIIQLISGAVGGNVAGSLLSKFNLGPIGNSVAGILGGGLGGQLVSMLTGAAAPGAGTGGLDLSSILSNIGGGGIGGAVLMVVVGLIKAKMSKVPL